MRELTYWQDLYESSKQKYEDQIIKFRNNQKQYDGELQPDQGASTKNIYNFTQELIESSIDNGIPQPKVEPRIPSERNLRLAKIAEDMIKGEMKRLNFEMINDIDERNTKIMGGDIGLPEWNNAVSTHNTSGAIDFRLISPTQFIPQHGVYEKEKMDYMFLVFNDTKERLEKRYDCVLDAEGLDCAIDGNAEISSDDLVTQVLCYYRNEKGSIGCISWAGDTVLIDDDEYQCRGEQICTRCGKAKVAGENTCRCGNRSFEKRNLRFEQLTEDIERSDGSVIPSMSYARDGDGNYATRETEVQRKEINPQTGYYEPVYEQIFDDRMNVIGEAPAMEVIEETFMEPTRIPYYTPKSFPVCIRQNISKNKSVIGLSDCDMIRDLQMEADKTATKMFDKIRNEGSIVTKPKGLNFKYSNGIRFVEISDPSQVSMMNKVDIRFDTQADVNSINQQYMWAKSVLGINETSQGKPDTTATSGKAKEVQVQRALGRQASKVTMKNCFYREIFRTIFEFALAYSDEPRRFNSRDETGENVETVFNRYDFLEQDEYGNWFYNDEFDFLVDTSGTASEDRQAVLNMMQEDFNAGLYGDKNDPETMYNFWKDRDLYNYPGAKRQMARWSRKVEEMKLMREQSQQQAIQPQIQSATESTMVENTGEGVMPDEM